MQRRDSNQGQVHKVLQACLNPAPMASLQPLPSPGNFPPPPPLPHRLSSGRCSAVSPRCRSGGQPAPCDANIRGAVEPMVGKCSVPCFRSFIKHYHFKGTMLRSHVYCINLNRVSKLDTKTIPIQLLKPCNTAALLPQPFQQASSPSPGSGTSSHSHLAHQSARLRCWCLNRLGEWKKRACQSHRGTSTSDFGQRTCSLCSGFFPRRPCPVCICNSSADH